ncbi:MAG: amidoligase family protein [Methylobacter sp.]|uniref:amidoligase family protein n=1 Tax=Methylobacter sp. TaxID=2051955 RepID=UPI002730930B|nr:amidoligase family protein [Methylobacter sp.]MDP1665455.1 amidoligase family protein [Methylobacter sp.]
MYQTSNFFLPPISTKASGEMRRVGVELEFSGLTLENIARLINEQFGGTVIINSAYENTITGTSLGDFKVELDFQYLKEKGRYKQDTEDFLSQLDEWSELIVRMAAEQIVPFEIVSPPIPMDRLGELELLIPRLRESGAQGTDSRTLYAFGLHFNPELPSLDHETIVCYLKAFLCLYDWLARHSKVNLTRSMTGYISPFPTDYTRQVIDLDYHPDQDRLIDDYLIANPTRNRVLDLLPLFTYLDKTRTLSVIDDKRVHPRPTLHYRLPNCQIDKPGWNIGMDWHNWLMVERLACNPECLDAICRAYIKFLDRPVADLFQDWKEIIEICLKRYCGL